LIHVLMIEDDGELAQILTEYLARFNITVTNYESPELGLSALPLKPYDLVILDLSLPELDGLEVCRMITEKHDLPIIISSARSDITDKIACLQMGADDYLPKPYDPRELAARIQTVLRRYRRENSDEEKENGPFELDEDGLSIHFEGEPLNLTRAEYGILAYLIKNRGRAISREELIHNVDAINDESGTKSIDVIVGRLRQKFENDPKHPSYLLPIRGVGYKLVTG